MSALDPDIIRKDFPVLARVLPSGKPLVYLDNGATSQKPQSVIDEMDDFYSRSNANVHRGVHFLSEEASARYEDARRDVASLIGADEHQLVFTKNSTEALNLVAYSLAAAGRLGPGREVLITEMEHHSNIVPWQLVTERTGATLRWLPLTDDGRLDLSDLDELINERTAVVSFVHQSNILGTVNPVARIAAAAQAVGALVVLDASQSVPHMPVDVATLGVDLMAFTGHKMFGPTGIGCLWGRRDVLEMMPPFLGGGDMIADVTMARSTYAELPYKFEAGTPPIAEAIGLGAAARYLSALGMDLVAAHEHELTGYALNRLADLDFVTVIGPTTTQDRGGAISFAVDAIHPHDVGQILDAEGVAVRVGHHCAKPVCRRYGVPATSRASFAPYTTTADIDALIAGLHVVRKVFA